MFSQIITQAVNSQLDELQKHLIESGLDEKKVNEAFQKFAEPTTKKYVKFDKVQVVLNYGSSHAVFGDFGGSLSHIKNDHFLKLKWIKYNKNLAYGPGWTLLDSKKLPTLEKIFKQEGVKYTKLDRKEFDKEYRKTHLKSKSVEESEEESSSKSSPKSSPKSQEESSSKSKSSPKASKSKESDEGSSSKPRKKGVVKKNKWKNVQEPSTGFIFGKINAKKYVVIGTQDEDVPHSVVGLESVIRLSRKEELQCEEYQWEYLTDETKITKKYQKLKDTILGQDRESDEDSPDIEDSDEDDESPDVDDSDDESPEDSGPVYYEMTVQYEDYAADEDDDESGGSVDVIVEFESQEHYELLEGDTFDTMGPLFNAYFDTAYKGEMRVDGVIECVKQLKKKPTDDEYIMVVKRE